MGGNTFPDNTFPDRIRRTLLASSVWEQPDLGPVSANKLSGLPSYPLGGPIWTLNFPLTLRLRSVSVAVTLRYRCMDLALTLRLPSVAPPSGRRQWRSPYNICFIMCGLLYGLYVCVCMCVCMYVCMYVGMYVRKYVNKMSI